MIMAFRNPLIFLLATPLSIYAWDLHRHHPLELRQCLVNVLACEDMLHTQNLITLSSNGGSAISLPGQEDDFTKTAKTALSEWKESRNIA